MAPLEIIASPVAVAQIPLWYANAFPADDQIVGQFHNAEGSQQLVADFTGKVHEVNLSVVKKFIVQILPGYAPCLLLVFDSNPNPRIGAGLHFVFAVGSEWTMGAAGLAPITTNYDVSTNYGLRGPNTFGPIELPGDFKYFRAYIIRRLTTGGNLGGQSVQMTQTGTTQVTPWHVCYNFVTFYGK